jgi:hypothetical protein
MREGQETWRLCCIQDRKSTSFLFGIKERDSLKQCPVGEEGAVAARFMASHDVLEICDLILPVQTHNL